MTSGSDHNQDEYDLKQVDHAMIETWIKAANQAAIFLYPTDTVYAIGAIANAHNAERINALKQRAAHKSLSIIVPSISWIKQHLAPPEHLDALIASMTEPYTLLVNKQNHTDFSWLSQTTTVGVRYLGQHPIQSFITQLNQPFISTSANLSGEPTVCTLDAVSSALVAQVKIRGDGMSGVPSTLIECSSQAVVAR